MHPTRRPARRAFSHCLSSSAALRQCETAHAPPLAGCGESSNVRAGSPATICERGCCWSGRDCCCPTLRPARWIVCLASMRSVCGPRRRRRSTLSAIAGRRRIVDVGWHLRGTCRTRPHAGSKRSDHLDNTKAWKNALRRAGIEHFRWHHLRHMWAMWHLMAGTTLGELRELGAWESEATVRRYAHFAPEQMRKATDRLATFWCTDPKKPSVIDPQVSDFLVPAVGIEPASFPGLRCSH